MIAMASLGSWLPELGKGAEYTILLTFAGMAFALVFGLVLALPRLSKKRNPVGIAAQVVVDIIRSTPLILQLFYIYFVFPSFGLSLTPVEAGILGLGVNYGAYISEVYRSGIQAVERGQWEAASALAMDYRMTMGGIILPQAIRITLPALGNYFISLFKDTALVSTISVSELLFSGQLLAQQTFQYVGIYSTIFVIYFLISYPASLGVKWLEHRLKLER